jgi:hypothetical protein
MQENKLTHIISLMRDTAFITVTEQDNPPQPQAQN